jgi:hypothetical protein
VKKKIPKIVHQFWLGGEKIPELYERCIERNRGQLSTNGFEHFLYDDRDVSHILSWGKGDRFKRIYQAIPKREIACRKDFLATLVLHYKGGFALDCSMYIRSLASLSENYSHCLRYRHYMGKKARAACQYAIPCGFGFLGSMVSNHFGWALTMTGLSIDIRPGISHREIFDTVGCVNTISTRHSID